jgi:DeoR family transcriptional regulator, suf operon transcriptional repressor
MIARMTTPAHSFSEPNPFPLPGHKGVRGAVLVELKKGQRLTARELAAKLGVSHNAVRHHLRDLEAESLVQYERRHNGVGAPAFAYRLTSAGEALFPRRYEDTLTDVLDHVVAREGRAGAVGLLEARYAGLTRQLQARLAGAGPEERMAAVAQLLSDQGFMAETTLSSSASTLVEHNCAIQAVAERFPEICAAEARFLADVLGAEVDRQAHILSGCSACEYRVRFRPATGDGASSAPLPEEKA